MEAPGVTLDTGALVQLSRRREGMRRIVAAAREANVAITIPANAIAEWWRRRTDHCEEILSAGKVQPVTERIAKLAGESLARIRDVDNRRTIDATIIATAALYGPILYTSDFDDMQLLRESFFPAVHVLGTKP